MSIDVDLTRLDELSRFAVPNWVRGVWQRGRIRTEGAERNEHLVVWIQTPTLYADVRTLRGHGAVPPKTADEGFAGWLDVEGQICRWKRPIDLKPRPEDSDQGAMFYDGDDLIEIGLFGNYLEEYHRIDTATRCFAASRGAFSIDGDNVLFDSKCPIDVLVSAGPYVTHARRAKSSALRHGRYDASAGTVHFEVVVGDPAVFTSSEATWTVWTDNALDRDALLNAASAHQT